ncbi:16S rRNA (guanine966-N2)-methyltransferase [Novosphingobium chloroacetimidivorans]|uniref:16S rRNA (Guanine966-N2)-methyltransferase n=1 Tax=Novosphingobium chloroacetimidivorans TaxID=1428314 RepID=A0A7W7K6P6_9SPHN|nr:16S rRNA (guanine(966)-N(2))-methyltransferase RsmD [Novosphingobium chloroacetimidivorans]MBB4856891.1 16S rRNA (guanine966-N2)-methyltransferase [Novosphingobium chloroacetimidivorans]
MRIIAGEWRGRPLVAPEGEATRPTSDRTRETLFSMLTSRLGSFEDLRVADLFAGSGALGLEALSRGAAHCMFVEQDPGAIRALRRNITNLRAQEQCDVRATSVMAMGPLRREPLDLVLLDPPYETGAGQVAVDKLTRLGWIAPSAWISLETSRKEDVSLKGYEVDATRDVGKARLHLLRPAA